MILGKRDPMPSHIIHVAILCADNGATDRRQGTERSMKPIDGRLIEHITQTIVEHCNPRRIILFGSHARGNAGPDSDLDIFVEMETRRNPYARAIVIDSLFDMRDWPMDIIVYTPEEVKRWTGQVGTMLHVIEQEGRVLYECDTSPVISRVVTESTA